MKNLIILLLALLFLVIGIYYFQNPKKLQQREINRVKYFKFLLRSDYTSRFYYNMLESAKSDEYLKRAKLVSIILIIISCIILLILTMKLSCAKFLTLS